MPQPFGKNGGHGFHLRSASFAVRDIAISVTGLAIVAGAGAGAGVGAGVCATALTLIIAHTKLNAANKTALVDCVDKNSVIVDP